MIPGAMRASDGFASTDSGEVGFVIQYILVYGVSSQCIGDYRTGDIKSGKKSLHLPAQGSVQKSVFFLGGG